MKHLIGAAVATAALATPAWAGTSSTYTMTGTVAGVCTVQGTGSINFNSLINTSTGATSVPSGTVFSADDNSAFCNQANTSVTITHTNLFFTAGTVPNGFTNVFPITQVKVSSPQLPAGISEVATPSGTGTTAGFTGTIKAFNTLKIEATTGAPTGSLLANTAGYSGTISISLSPTN